ncbi:uncharacterized protein LOC141628164 [Silene latifolia]|uniref:uncharacterized protein LOC141628164 n=1 Tax=Silene latifolia TaxID=37657 RepID=UPI003D77A687
MKNLATSTQKELRNLSVFHKNIEAQVSSQALAKPQRPPGSMLAQGQNSRDASTSLQAHAVLLRSGLELEDPYKDLEVEVDLKRKIMVMNDGRESPPMIPSIRMSDTKKGRVTSKATQSWEDPLVKYVDGFVQDLPYEEEMGDEASQEILVQPPKKVKNIASSSKVSSNSQLITNIPYPSRAIRSRENFNYTKFHEMLDKLEISLPFTEVILNMPTYAKFLKDILAKKRTLGSQELVALTEDCSAVLLNKMATKLGDTGSFCIPCVIGNVPISRALCDLGGKFFIPSDFVVLDIPEDSFTPIILGSPFLDTGGVFIDV